ncbi:hypothetical protein Hanom_Chr11g01060251 [Helianthus anomalus]
MWAQTLVINRTAARWAECHSGTTRGYTLNTWAYTDLGCTRAGLHRYLVAHLELDLTIV